MGQRMLSAAARERVAAALEAGSLIEAIRLYRQDTLSSLKDAKEAVEAMEVGRQVLATPTADAEDAIRTAIYAGRKIEAIKQYRLAHRVDLRQARNAVDTLEAELRQTTPEQFAGPAKQSAGCGGGAVIALLILAAAAAAAWHSL